MNRPPVGPPRGVLKRDAPVGRTEHERIAPSPAFAPFIAHFWTVRWDFRGAPPFLAETLPHPCVHLLFERGRAVAHGVATRRFRRKLSGQGRVFGIKFRPAAFQPVLGSPLSRITDRSVTLRAVFGQESDGLKEAILAEADVERCVTLAEAFLEERLPPMPSAVEALRNLVERLAADPGIARVEEVAELAGMDVRTLQRRFRATVGVSPKWVLQRYRLHEAAEQLVRPDGPDMARLALELGYFDQSHFIRDFKRVVGRSPGEYLAGAVTRRL